MDSNRSEADSTHTCTCGRSFLQPGPLKHHQRSCLKNKKRLFGVLEKAKEVWTSKKRQRLEDLPRDDGLPPQTTQAVDPPPSAPVPTTVWKRTNPNIKEFTLIQ
jgi:hypothetical protein